MSVPARSGRRWLAGRVIVTAGLAYISSGADVAAIAAAASPDASIAPTGGVPPSPSATTPSAPRVQLMFAVANAEAYERVMALVADARLTAMDGEAFVVVGAFADARTGHELGRALQRRLGLPFELVYDPQHPQADLAWLNTTRAVAARSAVPPSPAPRLHTQQVGNVELRSARASRRGSASPSQQPRVRPEPPVVVAAALHYLYARPRDGRQRQLLAQSLGLAEEAIPASGAEAPSAIRIGVFRETRRSLQLLERRQEELRAMGIPVERHRRSPGTALLIGMTP